MFHPEDKTFLCKTVTFMASVLMAGRHLYNAVEHNFRDFWSWNISPNNPFYAFKQQLLEVGKKIHLSGMDSYEVSSLAALLFVASGKNLNIQCNPSEPDTPMTRHSRFRTTCHVRYGGDSSSKELLI